MGCQSINYLQVVTLYPCRSLFQQLTLAVKHPDTFVLEAVAKLYEYGICSGSVASNG